MQLLDEGTAVARPIQAIAADGYNAFVLLPTKDHDRDDEHWEFLPGSTVECVSEARAGETILVARKLLKKTRGNTSDFVIERRLRVKRVWLQNHRSRRGMNGEQRRPTEQLKLLLLPAQAGAIRAAAAEKKTGFCTNALVVGTEP